MNARGFPDLRDCYPSCVAPVRCRRLEQRGARPRRGISRQIIARIERADPASPAVLSAQLAYADYLLSEAPGPCAERLVRAQEQLGSVDASPKGVCHVPRRLGSRADLEYRLHLARPRVAAILTERTSCGRPPLRRAAPSSSIAMSSTTGRWRHAV